MSADPPPLDVIGDVHGHLTALTRLGRRLGYDVELDWHHPDGRLLLFVGDLVDRGPSSLEVCELVLDLQRRGRALVLMGNHELNLIRTLRGPREQREGVRRSNQATVRDVLARAERWGPVLEGLGRLPLAWARGELRVVHAMWDTVGIARLAPLLPVGDVDGPAALTEHLVLGSPFEDGALRPGLPLDGPGAGGDPLHAVLLKGEEVEARSEFLDAQGGRRQTARLAWWRQTGARRPVGGRTVFGHYWNLPPRVGSAAMVPPYLSGHPLHADWLARHMPELLEEGEFDVPPDAAHVCVDYNGVLKRHDVGCVGAYRHPEGRVAWVCEPRA